jgi:urea transporter/murein DD-endopeptidase MepM/ murein hydrolase activator NlpD
MNKKYDIPLIVRGILNSYSQVFFSDKRLFAVILLAVTFVDLYAGLFGLISVIITNLTGYLLGYDKHTISKGIYGFNSLLVGLGLGIYYSPDLFLLLIVILAAILTLFISVSMQGIIGKYALPYLSIPFLLSIWTFTLATREFTVLGISERGIYTFNDLYILGGNFLVRIYEWWNNLQIERSLKIYLISLGAILFQFNLLSGILIAIGLLCYSRISFTLSLLGFYTAYLFYEMVGADISEISYSYIGFNYILTSIALGGFFIIPSARSYLWVMILIPLVAIITISLSSIFSVFILPLYSLPFNIVVLLFLYSLKFRTHFSTKLTEVFIQQNSPEKNLYSFHNDLIRFRHHMEPVKLPFFGTWTISQAHDDEYTHKAEWKHAWDFIITDSENNQYKGNGDQLTDYYCYDKAVIAPADGTVEHVDDDIPDNKIGEVNIEENWGNTVIIKHADNLYSSLSHLKPGSLKVKQGDHIREGDMIGNCGNSGRSPYPHIHFQLQSTPYIGSHTLHYPLSYYILHTEKGFELCQFQIPQKDQKISNIELNELIHHAFDFIPGQKLSFKAIQNESESFEEWEVQTDPYNNPYIICKQNHSKAWFTNDGNLLYFKHYEGRKNTLLYYFFIAAFKVQQGFYDNLVLHDKFPINLIFKHPLLGLQDFFAPFWKFLQSDYLLNYNYIDNELSPSKVILKSKARNRIFSRHTKEYNCTIELDQNGVKQFAIEGKGLTITAICQSD